MIIEYYPNGNLKVQFPCKSNKIVNLFSSDWNGWYKKYYFNGTVDEEVFFENDQMRGIQKKNTDFGSFYSLIQMKRSKTHGIEINFNYYNNYGIEKKK